MLPLPLRLALRDLRSGLSGLDEGQKVTYEIVKDKRTGKNAADNLQAS